MLVPLRACGKVECESGHQAEAARPHGQSASPRPPGLPGPGQAQADQTRKAEVRRRIEPLHHVQEPFASGLGAHHSPHGAGQQPEHPEEQGLRPATQEADGSSQDSHDRSKERILPDEEGTRPGFQVIGDGRFGPRNLAELEPPVSLASEDPEEAPRRVGISPVQRRVLGCPPGDPGIGGHSQGQGRQAERRPPQASAIAGQPQIPQNARHDQHDRLMVGQS